MTPVIVTTGLLVLAFAASPLCVYIAGTRRSHDVMRGRGLVMLIYYTGLLLCIAILAVPGVPYGTRAHSLYDRILDLLKLISGPASAGLVLAGPFIAVDLRASAKMVRSRFCGCCGYDLTGNVSGVCSECGTDVTLATATYPGWRDRVKAIPWRRFLAGYLAAVVLLLLAVGYVRATGAYICSECGRHECRRVHRVGLPGGFRLFAITGGTKTDCYPPNPLIPYLDPDGKCQHNWVGLGWDSEGWTGVARGIGADPLWTPVADEPDFGKFLAERPRVLERIRADLRKRQSIREWIGKEYAGWQGQRQ